MAGITNSAFRRLCREYGGGLYVAEMVTSRALVERTPESLRIISHDDDEKVRVRPAVRRGPRDRRPGRPDARRGGPRGPHRPQLRLPRAQGDPARRRFGAAVEDRPVHLDRPDRGQGSLQGQRPADHQDAQGHRRGPPHLPRRRPDRPRFRRRRRRPPRPHRRAVLLRPGRLVRDRPAARSAAGHPGPRQRRHLVRRGRHPHGPRDRRATASSSAAAARAARGCSATSWPRSKAATQRHRPDLRQVAGERVPPRRADGRDLRTTRARPCREIRKHMAWYFKGYVVGSELRTKLATGHQPRGAPRHPGPAGPRLAVPRRRRRGPARPRRLAQEAGAAQGLAAEPRRWTPSRPARSATPNWTCPVAETRTTAPVLDGYAARDCARWVEEPPKIHLPLRLRARPRPGPALLGAAPARRQDPGAWPRTPTTSSGPASPTASRWPRWAANWAVRSAATPTSSTPPASATTSATRPSATTAKRALNEVGRTGSAASRATPRRCGCSPGWSPRSSPPTAGRPA